MKAFNNIYRGKKILITGHTGFKGSWLCRILNKLGADVYGISIENDSDGPTHYSLLDLDESVSSTIADIRDLELVTKLIAKIKPDFIFHMAAQSLVKAGYSDPVYNYSTNIMGTVNIFEAVRVASINTVILNITTDKCYENNEWLWPYRENDALGGYDPYSASKACSEIVTSSYQRSFFNENKVKLASCRAGNVIGGGDFSVDRILPDIYRAIESNEGIEIRSPHSIRPWQFVIDVLFGYLKLGKALYESDDKVLQSAFNFSPSSSQPVNVLELARKFISDFNDKNITININQQAVHHEATMLRLDSSKARKLLAWDTMTDINTSIKMTAQWYKVYLNKSHEIKLFSDQQIDEYFKLNMELQK